MENRYIDIIGIDFYGDCSSVSEAKWHDIMNGAKRGNRRIIKRLLKNFGFKNEVEELMADNNPYKEVYISREWLILRHSAIEYFFRLTRERI